MPEVLSPAEEKGTHPAAPPVGEAWERRFARIEPRSAYLLSGTVRNSCQHSIAAMDVLRYSVTLRTFRSGHGSTDSAIDAGDPPGDECCIDDQNRDCPLRQKTESAALRFRWMLCRAYLLSVDLLLCESVPDALLPAAPTGALSGDPAGFGPLCVPLLPAAAGPSVGAALFSEALVPAALADALSVGSAPLWVPVLPGAVPAPLAAALPGCGWFWLVAGTWLSLVAHAPSESRAALVISRRLKFT